MSDLNTFFKSLLITPRTYDYIRQMAIQNVYDAIPELITNSVDAYNKMHDNDNTLEKNIDIIVKYPNNIIVRDYACGLSASQMQTCFLEVGNYTADYSSRGMMGRGAKDICVLGDILFESIKDNLYSKCLLRQNATGSILIADQPVENIDRETTNIFNNGTVVTILLSSRYKLDEPSLIQEMITNDYVHRDILTNPQIKLKLQIYDSNNILLIDTYLKYTYPKSNKIFKMTYIVEDYPDAEATLEIFKTLDPIPSPRLIRDVQNGILVASSHAIYQCNFLTLTNYNVTNTKFIYGRLQCNYLHDLLINLQRNGQSNENPYTILDPSRRSGLNILHPFVNNLFSTAVVWLDLTINNMQNIYDQESQITPDFKDILNTIQQLGKNIINANNIISIKETRNLANNTIHLIKNIEIDTNIVNIDNSLLNSIPTYENIEFFTNESDIDFKIILSNDPTMNYKYILYRSGTISILKLDINDVSIKSFFKDQDGVIVQVPGSESAATLSIINIIIEAFAKCTSKQDFSSRNSSLSIININEAHSKVFDIYEENILKISQQIYSALNNLS